MDMKIIIFLSICLVAAYLFHRLCLWLEKKGYLYYRHKKPEKGIIGGAMEELQGILNPGVRHTIEMKRNEAKHEQNASKDDSPKDKDKTKDTEDKFTR